MACRRTLRELGLVVARAREAGAQLGDGATGDPGDLDPVPSAAGPPTCQTPGVQRFAESQDLSRGRGTS